MIKAARSVVAASLLCAVLAFAPGAAAETPTIAGVATTASGTGHWLVDTAGRVAVIGEATGYGSLAGKALNQPIVGIARTPTDRGYWLVARDGGIFAFGDARFHGSTGAIRLNQPIVGMAPAPSGRGYWLVARDGGIFTFGDAPFLGSTGATRLTQPIVGMVATGTGKGYWLVSGDGRTFSFGDATAAPAETSSDVVAVTTAHEGDGYVTAGRGGALKTFRTKKSSTTTSTTAPTTTTTTAPTTTTTAAPTTTTVPVTTTPAPTSLLQESFDGPDGVFASDVAFWDSLDLGLTENPDWFAESGTIARRAGAGAVKSSVFRMWTRRTDLSFTQVDMDVRFNGWVGGSEGWHGINLWLNRKLRTNENGSKIDDGRQEGYAVKFLNRDGRLYLQKKSGDAYHILNTVTWKPQPGQWYRFGARVVDAGNGTNRIQVLVDGQVIQEAIDDGSVGGPRLLGGRVGVRGDYADFEIDDLSITRP